MHRLASPSSAWRTLAVGLALPLVLAACTPARVQLPSAGLDDVSTYPVSGHSPRSWRQPVTFGPFRTSAVEDGGTFTWTETAQGTTLAESLRPYRFVLHAGATLAAEVECRSQRAVLQRPSSGIEIDASAFNRELRLECLLHEPRSRATWVLALRAERDGGLAGELERGATFLPVRSLHQYAGSSWPSAEPLGFAIEEQGDTVLVVETLNAGSVVLGGGRAPGGPSRRGRRTPAVRLRGLRVVQRPPKAATQTDAMVAETAAAPYAHRSSTALAADAARAFILALPGLLFAWPPAEFVMLYTLQLGLSLVLTAPMMFAADRVTLPGKGGFAELAVAAGVGAVFWLVVLFVPLTAAWVLPVVAPGESLWPGVLRLGALDWAELAVPLAVLAGLALWRGRAYARAARAGRAPDLKRPFMHRAICVAAFVFFGPAIYRFLLSTGEAGMLPITPAAAIVLAYACCEAYPFLSALADRLRGHAPG